MKMQTLTDEHMAEGLSFLILWKFSISEKTIYYKLCVFAIIAFCLHFLKKLIVSFLFKCWMETFWNIPYMEENESAVKARKNWMYS